MSQKLKIIPLGGLHEIGKNLTVYEFDGDIIVVDCGLAFPDDEMYGVDLVIPDISYLIKHKNRVKGVIITHGHEDHIGALPYFLREINAPIYATKLTAGIIEKKLEESRQLKTTKMHVIASGASFPLGKFRIEFIHVNHSIADAVSLAISCDLGTVIHTGDFKLDTTPISGNMMNLTRFGEYGRNGVLALLSDSTNVERSGYSFSERVVGETFDSLFKNCDKRIIITTFASNVHRVQQVINSAAKYGRKVALSGRSMENIIDVAKKLGYMNIPPNVLIELNTINRYPIDKVCIITTGSQGEAMSALYRIAFSDHKKIEIMPGDRVIISASPIPGNEKTVSRLINELFKRGAEVIYEKLDAIHVSGHAFSEELKLMLALTKPRYFMPVHGEYRHLIAHAHLAEGMGVPAKNIFVSEIGRVLEISEKSAKLVGSVPSGKIFVDGLGVGDVGSVVIRDRKHLAQDGLITVVVTLSSEDNSIIAGPDIVSRGFIYVKEAEELMEEIRRLTINVIETATNGNRRIDWTSIKGTLKQKLSDFLYSKTKRSPMILPIIMEI